jgi:hypothetical protein
VRFSSAAQLIQDFIVNRDDEVEFMEEEDLDEAELNAEWKD